MVEVKSEMKEVKVKRLYEVANCGPACRRQTGLYVSRQVLIHPLLQPATCLLVFVSNYVLFGAFSKLKIKKYAKVNQNFLAK
jgi:hypothetical protein